MSRQVIVFEFVSTKISLINFKKERNSKCSGNRFQHFDLIFGRFLPANLIKLQLTYMLWILEGEIKVFDWRLKIFFFFLMKMHFILISLIFFLKYLSF